MQKKKTAIITARMTPADKAKIVKLACLAKMTVTDYLVTCALNKKITQLNNLEEILAELKAQGRELNQLTTLANMGRLNDLQIDKLIEGYVALCDKLNILMQEGF